MVHIEIDGKKLEVPQGQMIIEVADKIGIAIPRFCYHKKLSIAANCRMCLVEVANAPKPLPACATPVSEGMVIFTTSQRAIDAQKGVMEFLLINHPLDCPICDQGGQCELQDVAMGYGKDASRYEEGKRVVKDKNIGPLISTEMTRCIQCTRCVRFGTEIANQREMGATGRGEFMEIGTYVEKSVDSELSGNIIDLCPVGALTSKPFRFKARAWELQSRPSLSAHDCIGSNLFLHTLRGKVMRALPRENEGLNEVWLSDRDRFGYEGLNHADRLETPMIKHNGQWQAVDWETALSFAVEKLKALEASQIGALASPNSTLEEFYLLQKLLRAKGCHHIDHRLRQLDFRHQQHEGLCPTLGISLGELEHQDAVLVIGSDIRKEQPLIAHRLRKMTTHGGALFTINAWGDGWVGEQGDLIGPLVQIVKALQGEKVSMEATQIATQLRDAEKTSIILGAGAWSHPQASHLYALSRLLAEMVGATWGEMSNGANSAGGWLAGCVPHRAPFGRTAQPGLNAQEMLQHPRQVYVLLHCEPEFDTANPQLANHALKQAQTVIALTAFDNPNLRETADVLLPVTPISEMDGTYINAFGDWQRFKACATPLGQSRPAWKVLRVLANFWNIPDFDYDTLDAVFAEIEQQRTNASLEESLLQMPKNLHIPKISDGLIRLAPTPLYAVDGIVRRAHSLQQTTDSQQMATIRMHSMDASQQKLQAGQKVWVMQNGVRTKSPLPIEIDDRIPKGTVLVAAGLDATQTLGAPYGQVELWIG